MTVNFFDTIIEGSANDVPHHHFHTLGSGFAHVLSVGDPCQFQRITGQTIEKASVEVPVDEAGTLALQLMRHPARAEDHHLEVLIKAFHCTPDGASELEATGTCWRWILHDVDA